MRARRRPGTVLMVGAVGAVMVGGAGVGAAPAAAADLVPPTTCVAPGTFLVNPGFETPAVGEFYQFPQDDVPGWSTTDPSGTIEIWNQDYAGYPAPEGQQWAEINSESLGTLYQDVATTPGEQISYLVYHRSRHETNSAQIEIGAPGQPPDTVVAMTNDSTSWTPHFGTYTVPPGQSVTRFGFTALTGTGAGSVGNFLDGVSFGSAACGTVDLAGTHDNGGQLEPGDTITYTALVTNAGGFAMVNPVVSLPIPPGTQYVADTLRVVDGPDAGPVTDADDGDPGLGPVGGGPASIAVGGPAFGLLLAGASRTMSYQVQVVPEPAVTSIDNQVELSYGVPGGNDRSQAFSTQVILPLASAPSPTASITPTPSGSATPMPTSSTSSLPAFPTPAPTQTSAPGSAGGGESLANSGVWAVGPAAIAVVLLAVGAVLIATRRRSAS